MRGAIRDVERYAQAKMLDHSGWDGKLPRKITPSDIDIVWDNDSPEFGLAQMFCELSNGKREWHEIAYGQHLLYRNLVSRGRSLCVLLTHHAARTDTIDSMKDVRSFQVMGQDCGRPVYSAVYDGSRWERFVVSWHEDAPSICETIARNGLLLDINGNITSGKAG